MIELQKLLFFSGLLLIILCQTSYGQGECAKVPSESVPNRKVIISDLHLGAGQIKATKTWDPLEDFRFPDTFKRFLTLIGQHGQTDLIIAGDFIDFWQILPELDRARQPSLGSSEEESLAKLEVALAGHKDTFAVLSQFARIGKNKLIIIPGNHDVDLFWPKVQARLQAELGVKLNQKLFFTTSCYQSEGVYVEHGNQYDEANRFANRNAPFVSLAGKRRLQTNWGTVFMSRFYNELEEQRPFIDNLYSEKAAIIWALQNESAQAFSLPQAGRFLLMITKDQDALAQLKLTIRTLGPEDAPPKVLEKNIDNLLKLYEGADPELANSLRSLLSDKQTRKEAELALRELSDEEWRALQAGIIKTPRTETLGNLLLRRDPIVQGARKIVLRSPDVDIVVMGHTHDIERTEITRLTETGPKDKWYVNTGCWQKMLPVSDVKGKKKWAELNLDDPMFRLRFSYVVVDYEGTRPLKPTRSFWIE
jgi:UDP-2,3-diacylglucosamine pyrophosphatase LpxH